MSFTLHLSSFTRKQLYRRLQQAYASGALRLVKRIHALLALAESMSVQEVAAILDLGEQTVRDYRNRFLLKHLASLTYKRPSGRPSKLTKAQRRELATLIKAGPQAAGYTSGCWNTPMIHSSRAALGSRTIRIILRPCSTIWAFPIRRRALSRIISMRPSGWSGAAASGRAFYAKRDSARCCCCLAMKPALPSGARSAILRLPQASNPKCPPVANVRATKSLA
jgi:hypothetical protein